MRVLDVREDSEFEQEGHIPSASHLFVGYLDKQLERVTPHLEKGEPIAVTCSVGHRAGLATSILLRHGFERVSNLLGGMTAWNQLEFDTVRDAARSVTTPDIEGRAARAASRAYGLGGSSKRSVSTRSPHAAAVNTSGTSDSPDQAVRAGALAGLRHPRIDPRLSLESTRVTPCV